MTLNIIAEKSPESTQATVPAPLGAEATAWRDSVVAECGKIASLNFVDLNTSGLNAELTGDVLRFVARQTGTKLADLSNFNEALQKRGGDASNDGGVFEYLKQAAKYCADNRDALPRLIEEDLRARQKAAYEMLRTR